MPNSLVTYPFNRLIGSLNPYENRTEEAQESSPRAWYEMLRAYYESNGLYDDLQSTRFYLKEWSPAMKPIRNPASRSVEFFVAKIWGGPIDTALPIVTENENLVEAIHQIWTWSNWSSQKQVAARWLALYGDLFIKIVISDEQDRIFLQVIDTETVSKFDLDERGVIQYLRLDLEIEGDDGEDVRYVEVWDKTSCRIWRRTGNVVSDDDGLGPPDETIPLSDLGITFIPIVHAKFRDIGRNRGLGCFSHALDKIDEMNRMATRLHQLLFRFNKAVWALSANQVDSMNRPIPAPILSASTDGKVDFDDDTIFGLPGNSTLHPMVPPIDYGSSLAIVNAMMQEIEKDLPELRYFALVDRGDLSGVAIRLLMSDAIDRAIEARGNAESALVRVHQMAITVGQTFGLFPNVGTYESGDLDHSFRSRDVFPVSANEKAATFASLINAGMPFEESMRQAGYADDEIQRAVEAKSSADQAAQTKLAQTLMMQQQMKTFNAGGTA